MIAFTRASFAAASRESRPCGAPSRWRSHVRPPPRSRRCAQAVQGSRLSTSISSSRSCRLREPKGSAAARDGRLADDLLADIVAAVALLLDGLPEVVGIGGTGDADRGSRCVAVDRPKGLERRQDGDVGLIDAVLQKERRHAPCNPSTDAHKATTYCSR